MPIPHLHLALAADIGAARHARTAMHHWLADVTCPPNAREDALLVLGELIAGAVECGSRTVAAEVSFDHGRLHMDAIDDQPRAESSSGLADDLSRTIVDAATDGWGWTAHPDGTLVWATILC